MRTDRLYLIQDVDGETLCWTTEEAEMKKWFAENYLAEVVSTESSEMVCYFRVEFNLPFC